MYNVEKEKNHITTTNIPLVIIQYSSTHINHLAENYKFHPEILTINRPIFQTK